jgi:predicted metal-binding protein
MARRFESGRRLCVFSIPVMQEIKPLWMASGVVLVCEKCYKQRIPEETPEVAERIGDFQLRDWLKAQCKEAGLGKRVRVVNTGCLDVCGKGLVTVSILPQGKGGPAESFSIDPIEEREALLNHVIEKLG